MITVSEKHPTTHEALAADLGFKVDSSAKQVYYGENPRPATREEVLLWGRAVQAKAAFAGRTAEAIALRAEVESLTASCEAYREKLQLLHDFLAMKYPIQFTDDSIEYAMSRLSGLEQRKQALRDKITEIWVMPPGVDVFDFMLERLRDMTGESMAATEKRRNDTIKERAERFPGDPMNSMLADKLDELQARTAGHPVRRGHES